MRLKDLQRIKYSSQLMRSGNNHWSSTHAGPLPSTLCDAGHYSNAAFLLRSFVSLWPDADGDELGLSVDITAQPTNIVSIECDLCLENGRIVAMGPGARIDTASTEADAHIATWRRQFDAFLTRAESEAWNSLRAMASGG